MRGVLNELAACLRALAVPAPTHPHLALGSANREGTVCAELGPDPADDAEAGIAKAWRTLGSAPLSPVPDRWRRAASLTANDLLVKIVTT